MKRSLKPQLFGESANIPHTDQDDSTKKRKHSTSTNAGHSQSSIMQGRKVQFSQDGFWRLGQWNCQSSWHDKNEYEKKECKYMMQIKVHRETRRGDL